MFEEDSAPVDLSLVRDEQLQELLAADLDEARAFVRRCDGMVRMYEAAPDDEVEHALEEVAVALRVNAATTGARLGVALTLDAFARTRQALLDGVLGVPHALVLLDEIGYLEPALALQIEARVLDQAGERITRTPAQLRKTVHRQAVRLDPEVVERRRQVAREETDVRLHQSKDGVASLIANGPALSARGAMSLVDFLARQGGPDDQRPLGSRRYAALLQALRDAAGVPISLELELDTPVVTTVARVIDVTGLPEPVRIRADQPTLTAALRAAAQHLRETAQTTRRQDAVHGEDAVEAEGEQDDATWHLVEPPQSDPGWPEDEHGPADLAPAPPDGNASTAAPSTGRARASTSRNAFATLDLAATPVELHDESLVGRDVHLLRDGPVDAHLLAEALVGLALTDPTTLRVRRVCTDRASGRVVAVDRRPVLPERLDALPLPEPPPGTPDYRPTEAQRRVVQARDQHCTFPGCRVPVARCDIDHVVRYPEGPTSVANLHALCRRHHRLKHSGWSVERTVDGHTDWTSPRGQRSRRVPPDV